MCISNTPSPHTLSHPLSVSYPPTHPQHDTVYSLYNHRRACCPKGIYNSTEIYHLSPQPIRCYTDSPGCNPHSHAQSLVCTRLLPFYPPPLLQYHAHLLQVKNATQFLPPLQRQESFLQLEPRARKSQHHLIHKKMVTP
jgi:hypothetical protein